MEELKFEAPLAQFESEDMADLCSELDMKLTTHGQLNRKDLEILQKCLDADNNDVSTTYLGNNFEPTSGNFNETFSGSLEDLVNTFDDKITKCFRNYDETTEKLAPVQMRTQEELMNDCQ